MRIHLKGEINIGQFSELLKLGGREYMESAGKVVIPEDLGIVVSILDDLTSSINLVMSYIQGKSIPCFFDPLRITLLLRSTGFYLNHLTEKK